MVKILFIIGTRPEAIKIAPLYFELRKNKHLEIKVGLTGQHKELIYQALDFFEIKPDFDLEVMTNNQTLNSLLSRVILGVDDMLRSYSPDYIIVQGDTTTVLGASIAAFNCKVKVVHIEAGLRSFDKDFPFPEEMNRQLTSSIAHIHFAPTKAAAANLAKEGFEKSVHVVGNTVIDALELGLKMIEGSELKDKIEDYFSFLDSSKKTILMTCHRTENFGDGLKNIVAAVKEIASTFVHEVQFCFPVHPNPNIKNIVEEHFSGIPNFFMIEPLSYPYLLWIMNRSYFILTDSGGIQEEAPSLRKPVLVMREKTERWEGVEDRDAVLVGNNQMKIVELSERLITDSTYYNSFCAGNNPYGDGTASQQISRILNERYL